MNTINIWSILVASIVSFGIGALWYSPILFGKEWMSLSKISQSDIENTQNKGMFKYYFGQFIMTVLTFIVLGFAISNLDANGRDGAMIGLLAWLGFALPMGISSLLWENKPFKLVMINTISILLNLVIGGAIIGAWR